jgi:hypothetical protein
VEALEKWSWSKMKGAIDKFDTVTPDSIHCFKKVIVNHLSDDPFLNLKEMVIDSQIDETISQERANVEKVMMF